MQTTSECLEKDALVRMYSVRLPDTSTIEKVIVLLPDAGTVEENLEPGESILVNYNLGYDYCDGQLKDVIDAFTESGHTEKIANFLADMVMQGMAFYKANPHMSPKSDIVDFSIEVHSQHTQDVIAILQQCMLHEDICTVITSIFQAGKELMATSPADYVFGFVQN